MCSAHIRLSGNPVLTYDAAFFGCGLEVGMPLLSWLLNFVYALLLACCAPVLLYKAVRFGKYRDGFAEKLLGRVPQSPPEARTVWFHAVSVGEVLQLETIVPRLRREQPGTHVVISTTTVTGMKLARERFPDETCCYFPLDFSWAVDRAIARIAPSLIVLVELELWPNFIRAAGRRGIKLAVINGRMSDRSFRGYRRIRFLIAPLLRSLSLVAVQTAQYEQRFSELGARRTLVTGSIKFDRVRTNRDNPATEEIARGFGLGDDEIVLIAGSTQSPEEQMALDAWSQLRAEHPGLRLILVPRHRERFDEVARLVTDGGHALIRRSESSGPDATRSPEAVLLLDTLGELQDCWGLADIAFVGGSFGDRGGQNMIEPAAFGAAVLFGPNTWNFQDIVGRLLDQGGATVVPSTDDFRGFVQNLLADPDRRLQMGAAARECVVSQAGASAQTVAELIRVLNEPVRVEAVQSARAA